MVECYTAPRNIHLIGNMNIRKVPNFQRNPIYTMNNSGKNVEILLCGCLSYQQNHTQLQLRCIHSNQAEFSKEKHANHFLVSND